MERPTARATERSPAGGAGVEPRNARFERWLTEYRGIVFKVLRAYASTPQDQDDLFQEISVRLWTSIPRFRGESAESTWIYRVSLFTALDWVRSRARQPAELPIEAVAHVLTVEQERKDPRVEWLYEQIRTFDEVDRSVVLLLLDGFGNTEIASILGISANHVGVKAHRIRKRLAERLMEEGAR